MKIRYLLIIVPLLLILVAQWGCEPENPGAPLGNRPPDTRIVVAPLDSSEHDHYLSPSEMFHVKWHGHDPDGEVVGYWVQVDNNPKVWTTKGDSIIAFDASEEDPNDTTRLIGMHTIMVSAEDGMGLEDPTPATRTFASVNYPPVITSFVIAEGFTNYDIVGRGISFEVDWIDPNESGALFRLSVNDRKLTDWDVRKKFQFCDTSDVNILASLELAEEQPVDISYLPIDTCALKVEIKDLGDAEGEPFTRYVIVVDTVSPALTEFSATYGIDDFFADGSIFYSEDRLTVLTMAGDASSYYGTIQAYRYRYRSRGIGGRTWLTWSAWSEWGAAEVEFEDLSTGEYQFEAQCRDFSGTESDPEDSLAAYTLSIVKPDLEQMNILLVDETRKGNGRPGSPDDFQCDEFYSNIISSFADDGWTLYAHDIDSSGSLTPLRVYDKRIIIWHTDDKSQKDLPANEGILEQYLDAGGRLILSGWDILGQFTVDPEVVFTSGFVHDYLRIKRGWKENAREFIGMTGNSIFECPDLVLDPAKIPPSWNGLDNCWMLETEWRADTLGFWQGHTDTLENEGEPCLVRGFSVVNPWRTIVLGFPLYFMQDEDAKLFIKWAVDEIHRAEE